LRDIAVVPLPILVQLLVERDQLFKERISLAVGARRLFGRDKPELRLNVPHSLSDTEVLDIQRPDFLGKRIVVGALDRKSVV